MKKHVDLIKGDPYERALYTARLGETEKALQFLRQAREEHSGWLDMLKVDPELDNLRLIPDLENSCTASTSRRESELHVSQSAIFAASRTRRRKSFQARVSWIVGSSRPDRTLSFRRT